MSGIPNLKDLVFRDTPFANLMNKRIYNVLLIATKYDSFMLEDDGRVDEQIFNEYTSLSLRLSLIHILRNGCDPVADLKKYHTRVFDMHIKDVTDSSKAGVGIEIGRGKIDFPALIRMMREVNYTGMCSLEYEKDMKDPFLGIAESIGYFKAVSDLT